jgi:hypothetical protein
MGVIFFSLVRIWIVFFSGGFFLGVGHSAVTHRILCVFVDSIFDGVALA